ncbi:hypothetical protein KDD93_00370 [Campylobacter sp. faydin G-24]|uniref:Uncharacterized protein n=1 Tax=Campylobacter anatolicus TaxID=2829105 RepID=A0ABS5HFI0_9BACT|nr:hypothetical protein [Campylobacter anatolicus]
MTKNIKLANKDNKAECKIYEMGVIVLKPSF